MTEGERGSHKASRKASALRAWLVFFTWRNLSLCATHLRQIHALDRLSIFRAHTQSLSLSLSPARTHTHTQTHTRHTSSPPPLPPLPTPPPHIHTRTHTHMHEKGRHNLHRQRLPRERLLHTHSVQEEENERSCALIVRTDHSVRDRTSEREFIW